MLVSKSLSEPDARLDILLRAGEAPRVQGKFLLGRSILDSGRLMLVFDDQAEFHKDIALAHSLRPLGGGWCEISHPDRLISLSGSSQAFGREPDRERTLRCFRECLPGYVCEAVG